jgi:hypothetical protein
MSVVRGMILMLALILSSPSALAQFQMDFLNSKRNATQGSQWTLADWLLQKNQRALMDHWLSLNRDDGLFDVRLQGGHSEFGVRTKDAAGTARVTTRAQSYELDLYVSLFNLYGEYEKREDQRESYGGGLGLRLLGANGRTTSLVARYGWRKLRDLKDQEEWENQFAEGQLQVYVVKQFGLTGRYRHYFPSESNKGTRLEGHRVTAGAFIEFGAIRLYGNYHIEPIRLKPDGSEVKSENREGYNAGVALNF